MSVIGVMMGPMNDRQRLSWVVHEVPANFYAVSGLNRNARRDPDVIDDLNSAYRRLHPELFVLTARVRSKKIRWLRQDGSRQIGHERYPLGPHITRAGTMGKGACM